MAPHWLANHLFSLSSQPLPRPFIFVGMRIVSPATTYGAVLLGSFLAFALSGAISLQSIVYFKMYPKDGVRVKTLVLTVWFLDMVHSSFVCASLLSYFVTFFGEREKIDYIPWTIAFTVVVTAIQTFLVHCFYAQKILKASQRNWLITGPIIFLAACRLFAASVSTFEMIRLHRFSAFIEHYPGWVFTTGLSLSAGVDLIIAAWLCYYLREIRTRIAPDSTVMIRLVDSITIYTLENGALTCFTATASLICWLTMPRNLVFFGLHFIIGKLYANSLLASLNVRGELQQMRWNGNQRRRHGLDLSIEMSVPSGKYTTPTGRSTSSNTSMDVDMFTPAPKPHKIHNSEPNITRVERGHYRGYRPREPTIYEWKPASPV